MFIIFISPSPFEYIQYTHTHTHTNTHTHTTTYIWIYTFCWGRYLEVLFLQDCHTLVFWWIRSKRSTSEGTWQYHMDETSIASVVETKEKFEAR